VNETRIATEKEIAMKTITPSSGVLLKFFTLALIASLALAAHMSAQTITWANQDTILDGSYDTNWYRARVASDQLEDFVVVGFDNTTTAPGELAYWTSNNNAGNNLSVTSLPGISNGQNYTAGSNPSIAMASSWCLPTNGIVEVHQGNGADMYSYIGGFPRAGIGSTVGFTDGQQYDVGFNPAVGMNLNAENCPDYPNLTPFADFTVVEVHQANSGPSNLWYHVGTLSENAEGALSFSWGPAYQFDEGYLPSVAVCGTEISPFAIEVHQGASGPSDLWYSYGTISGNKINWNASQQYDVGYAPQITCEALGADGVIEVHQWSNPAAGEATDLLYHATTNYTSMGPSYHYDYGCAPSVTFAQAGSESTGSYVVEIHSPTCGQAGKLLYDYGTLPAAQ
jgi:hypothetical protein